MGTTEVGSYRQNPRRSDSDSEVKKEQGAYKLYELNSKDQHKRHKDTYVVLWRVRQGRKKRIYER